jgi:CDP-6-deoxy-D-xylo-4-hexulose-3-dehydrase
MNRYKINLAENTISKEELYELADWIKSGARLTKGELTEKFENEFSKYIGNKYSVFVNSGSSANLLMIYSLLESGMLKNKKAIIPAISWITTLSPFIQLGFKPYLCESEKDALGIDPNYFEDLCKKHNPSILILVHVLGHPNKMNEILEICNKYNVILLEDACEALGTVFNHKKLGSIGLAGSFSFYYGHHISTIEGGMVTTNNRELYNTMLSIRSHGWGRDIESYYIKPLMKDYDIDEFREFYTFYYPGFNLRSTDLNAFLGLSQIKNMNNIAKKRENNFNCYMHYLSNKFYYQKSEYDNLSSFAFGTFVKNRLDVYKYLKKGGVETRPLICGSMGKQPFWIKKYGETSFPVADLVHNNGIYLPNHLNLDEDKIKYICELFLDIAEPIKV